MKQLLKKTAVLWIAAAFALLSLCVPPAFHADAADGGTAYLTVEVLSLDLGFLCSPSRFEIRSGENAVKTLLRFLAERGYTVYYTGSSAKNFKLGYIASGDKTESHNGYSSAAKAYPVKNPKTISIEGQISTLAQAMVTTYGVQWDPAKDRLNIKDYLGEKDVTEQSGWVFSVNNNFVTGSLSDVTLSDGDTLRVQFSLAGGRDLGYSVNNGVAHSENPDRSRLIKVVADHRDNHAGSSIYDEAYSALRSLALSGSEITRLYGALVSELKSLDVYQQEVTTAKPSSTQSTTASTTSKTTTTAKSGDTSTTAKPTTTAPSTTAKPTTTAPSTTAKPTTTAPSTTAKPAEKTTESSGSTTKASTTANSGAVTVPQYNGGTTNPNAILTTVVGGTTLPGETTTIERPTGMVLDYVAKELSTTEPETTAEDETDEEETTAGPRSLTDKLLTLRNSDGMVRNVVIVSAAVVVAAIAAAIVTIKLRNKKTL